MFRNFTLGLSCLFLAGCAGLLGPRTVEVPLAKLQDRLNHRVILQDTRLLGLIDVKLGKPQLSLQPDTQRVQVAVDAAMAPILSSKGISGNFAVSGRLEIDAPRNVIVLRDPKLERLSLEGITPERQGDYTKVASMLVDRVSANLVVYQFDPNDLRQAGIQYYPSRIDVRRDSLAIILTPEK